MRRNYFDPKLNKAHLLDALKFGIPLLPHALSTWVRTGVDRILLTMLISSAATGLYTVGFQIASVMVVVTTAFNKAFKPFLFEQLSQITEEQKAKLVNYSYLYFLGLLVLAAFIGLAAPFIVNVFLGKEFSESQDYVSWFAFGFAFYGMNTWVANYILYTQKTLYLSYVTFSIGVFHVALSYFLISQNGIIGAVQATTVVSIITFTSVWWLSHKVCPMPWLGKRTIV